MTVLISCSSCKSQFYDPTSGFLPPAAAGAAHSERMRSEEPGSGLQSGAEQFVVFSEKLLIRKDAASLH